MIAGIIFVCSVIFLLQFFLTYCRSLIAASAKHALSAEAMDVTGIAKTPASGEDYERVVQLLQLCPEPPEERSSVVAISAYFRLLTLVRSTFARLAPSLAKWTDFERAKCAYFAVVALDRRIAFSRQMLAQQMDA